jgi:hypothetical protein
VQCEFKADQVNTTHTAYKSGRNKTGWYIQFVSRHQEKMVTRRYDQTEFQETQGDQKAAHE